MPQINILEELEVYSVKPEEITTDHAKIKCPFHQDDRASMSVRINGEPLGFAKCFGCGMGTDFVHLLVRFHEINSAFTRKPVPTANAISKYLTNKWGLDDKTPSIDPKVIDEFNLKLLETKDHPFRIQLFKRFVNEEQIIKFKLGTDHQRITIPIADEFGKWVNILRYLPNAQTNKFTSLGSGRGGNKLYPYDQFKYEKLVLTAGAVKAIAGTRLNEHGYGCVTALGGENSWDTKFNNYFKDKKVWVVYDADPAGYSGSRDRCADLYPHVESVYHTQLDFEVKKGGLDDYLFLKGIPPLLRLLDKAAETPWQPPQVEQLEDVEPEKMTLEQAYVAVNVGKRVELPIRVTGVCTTPYYAPKTYEVVCTKDAKNGICSLCPVYQWKGNSAYTKSFHPESKSMLLTVDKTSAKLNDALLCETGIPGSCNKHTFKILDYQKVEDIRVSPMLDLQETTQARQDLPALCLGEVEANSSYRVVGRMYPHPDSQKATLVLSKTESVSDDVRGWKNTYDLSLFRPNEESVDSKYRQILLFLERNVTRIYQRWEMHALMDLVYHTPLLFMFEGKLQNGWGQGLIVGDSELGKSEAFNYLSNFYQLGVKIDSKNATVAGIIGGCTPLDSGSKKQFIKWGVVPSNDGKLVAFEEIGGIPLEYLTKMTNMRSDGIAQLPKIENKSTKARTRLLMFGNPRSGRPMSTYTHGVDTFYEMFCSSADIRRFDLALCLKDANNKPYPDSNETLRFEASQEQFRAACLFAWTRTEKDFVFEDEAYIKHVAEKLSEDFADDKIPLLNKGSTKYKIAKLAAALATRLYSSDGQQVFITKEHVDWVSNFLRHIYEDDQTGYRKYCQGVKALNSIDHPKTVETEIRSTLYAKNLVDGFLNHNMIERQDIMDWGGMEQNGANALISLLVRCRCLVRKGRPYVKTPGFLKFLQETDWTSTTPPPSKDEPGGF